MLHDTLMCTSILNSLGEEQNVTNKLEINMDDLLVASLQKTQNKEEKREDK